MRRRVMSIAAVVAGWPAVAHGSPLTELASSLEPGEWGELDTLEIDAVLSAGGASGFDIGYSEDIVWDPGSQRLFFMGGDHNDVADHITYDEATNTWETLPRPGWVPSSTMHGYDHSAIDPGRQLFYHRPFANNSLHRYDIAADSWSMVPSPPDNGTSCCDAIEFFPDMDSVLWVHHSYGELWAFSEASQEWSMLDMLPAGDTWQVAEYNPVHQLVVFTHADTLYQLTSDGEVSEAGSLDVSIYDGSGFAGVLTVDPVSGDYLISTPGTENRTFHAFDPIAGDTAMLPTQPQVDLAATGMVGTPVADYGVALFVYCYQNTPCGVLVYKHAPFDIPPDPGTSSGPDDSGSGSDSGEGTSDGDAESSGGSTSSTAGGATTNVPSSDGSSGAGEGAADDEDAGGCGCTAGHDRRVALVLLLVLFACRRRNR